jgi:beta-mannosidase
MELTEGWQLTGSPPGRFGAPDELDGVAWVSAQVPGTAAGAIGVDGRDFDAEDWWFSCQFALGTEWLEERVALELDGVATVSQVFLNGRLVLESGSMWEAHELDVTGQLRLTNELVICCRALVPLLAQSRRPRARWRTRVVNAGNLRWHRTMVFGRSPGFAPGPAPVGPWRPIRIVRASEAGLGFLSIAPRLEGDDGVVRVTARPRGSLPEPRLVLGGRGVDLREGPDGTLGGELRVPGVERWWPHTHGRPALYELSLHAGGEHQATRQIGFRTLAWAADIPHSGLDLHVNDVPIFTRGAVWTPADLVTMAPDAHQLRELLLRVRDARMNMLRVVGTGAYESPLFHDLCDELGILVWQDMMFANLDYPVADPEFRAQVCGEARQLLAGLAGRPSLAVVCGNSEVEQQPAMMGLDPSLGRDELWDFVLPGLVAESGADCAYVRSTPCGGALPFHPDRGVSHYFGVSGYFHPLDDARRAGVLFASECLALANVPDQVEVPAYHPRWKAGVQRDAGTGWDLGAGWDFDDVRDHYLALLYDVQPVQLRRSDHPRYLELSRAASGEVMAEVMGEWRRSGSPCRGALVLWLKDMLPGAGLGVLDHRGQPKVAYHHLRRALSPIAVWTTDEGVSGVAVHVANDRPVPLRARLRVSLYRDLEVCLAETVQELELAAHGCAELSVEALLGRFVDAAWAYRFGPPAQDAIFVTLESSAEPAQLISQAVRFPAGRPVRREPAPRIGIEVSARQESSRSVAIGLRSTRVAHGVRLDTPGFTADDDAFTLEPGRDRAIRLHSSAETVRFGGGSLTALNLDGEIRIPAVA